MKYVAAYALLQLAGNNAPTAKQVQELIEGVSGTVNTEQLNAFITSVQGQNLNDVIAQGKTKLSSASRPAGGAVASAPAAAAAPAAAKKEEPKKEEPKEEEFEGAGDLFDF